MDEEPVSDSLRPQTWDDYIGQEPLKADLDVRIAAANLQERPLDHMLLAAPPGFGKTSLAQIIAKRRMDDFLSFTNPLSLNELAEVCRQHQGILFLDEVHRWSPKQQENLLPLLEDNRLEIGKGRVLEVFWLTVIAATTERHKLIEPLVQRFPHQPHFDPYTDYEMLRIVLGLGDRAGTIILVDDAEVLAKASGGSPRMAKNLVLAFRDLKVARETCDAEDVLRMMRIDPDGLTMQHYRYLEVLAQHCEGGQGGLQVLCSLLSLKEGSVLDLERLLLAKGLVQLGNRGRLITGEGYRKLNGRKAA